VKDFVRDVWKIAAGCAAGAFLLSLLIGLISGNPFGVSFFRAFLFAVLFAGLGAGLRTVVKTYLPELSSGGAPAADSPGAGGTTGRSVDIVLPEDDGLRRQAYGGSPRAGRSAEAELGDAEGELEEAADGDSLDEDSPSPAEAQALGELGEELAEELPGADSAEARPLRGAGPETEGEPVEEAETGDELARSARDPAGDLDTLPDIAALEPPSEQRSGSVRSTRMTNPGERPEDAVRTMLSGQDPATLARALRTVLKKDEKG
jgi:hypothetical protein